MAVIRTLACDKCSKQGMDVRTRKITLDGVAGEIELCDDDAKPLAELFNLGRVAKAPAKSSKSSKSSKPNSARNALIRVWAKETGVKVSERGRIAAEVVKAYELASA